MIYNSSISHRGYNLKCEWWSREKNSFGFEKNPNGLFYAKEISDKEYNRDYFGNNSMVLMERNTVMLQTPDNLHDIKTDDKIKFEDEEWFVASIGRKRIRNQQSEFTKFGKINYYWVLRLRK